MFKRGAKLKLSKEGLDFIYRCNPAGRARASKWRFEYRCKTRNSPECLSVKKLPQGYYCSYHESFLEKATKFWGI